MKAHLKGGLELMVKNFQKKVAAFKNATVNVEVFDSANEVVEVSSRRKITDSCFDDMATKKIDKDWTGVASLDEALELMRTGYQPTVDKMKTGIKANVQGQGKRISFFNDVVGYSPIVPLALLGVPNSMQNSYMKPIKAKVIDVYYDMTAACGTSKEDIIKAGQELLAAIMELEMQGYKFNLYAIQTYYGSNSADMLCTKIKSSNTPLDLKRISFPLTHTAYFRVIGFDWYSKTPKGKYRSAYGRALGYGFNEEQMQKGFREIFGSNCIVFSCAKILQKNSEHFKTVITANAKEVKE